MFLDSVDGSWRYDASTGDVTRLAGELVSDRSPLLINVSCESSLECFVEVDSGDGLTPADWIRASDLTSGSAFAAPDLTRIVIHCYHSNELTYFDLSSGIRVELGEVDIDPYRGVFWVPDSPWIVGFGGQPGGGLIAINVQTAEQLELDMPFGDVFEGFLVAAPPA